MPKTKKPRRVIEAHRDFMWPTSDDWHPNHERNTVRVRLSSQYVQGELAYRDSAGVAHEAFARLSVWGADDTGMETDRYCSHVELFNALAELGRLAAQFPNPLTKAWLTQHGFVPA